MGTRLPFPVKPATHKFFVGDLETIAEFHPKPGMKNAIVRELVHQYAKSLREQQSRSEIKDDVIAAIAGSIDLSGVADSGVAADDGSD